MPPSLVETFHPYKRNLPFVCFWGRNFPLPAYFRSKLIPFSDMDARLDALGRDRAWLAEASGRAPASIRAALAPNAPDSKRSHLLQRVLSDVILAAEAAQANQPPPGLHAVLVDDEQLDRADRASRIVGASSLAQYCREAIRFRTSEILAGHGDPVDRSDTHDPPRLRIAEDPGEFQPGQNSGEH